MYVTVLACVSQLVFGLLLGGIAGAIIVWLDPGLVRSQEELAEAILQVTIIPLAILSSLFTLGLIYASVVFVCRRPFLESLGLRRPDPSSLAGSLLLGAVAAALYVGVALLLPPGPDQEPGGPISKLAESGPFGHAVWIFLAVVMAPAVEEILFRGYAYLGARRKLGPVGAGAVVTVFFLLLHVTETGAYLPALAGIGTLATVLVVLMERTGNLTYCIACHLGYNAMLATMSMFGAE
jgi:membrane protease YdiL (CAAX protease family)